MKFDEAQKMARKFNLNPQLMATVVRILPELLDPPDENDNGWDVEVEVIKEVYDGL